MSTNLHNLARGRLGTLIGSAFITDGDDLYAWLPGLVCLLALGELFRRGGRLVVAFALGHIGATVLVAVAGGRGRGAMAAKSTARDDDRGCASAPSGAGR